jgi:hypothetical protein
MTRLMEKCLLVIVSLGFLMASAGAHGQAYSYVLNLNPSYNSLTSGTAIPYDFAGLGFETENEVSGSAGYASGYNFFNSSNTNLVTVFQNLSLRNLRVGGGTVDGCPYPNGSRWVPQPTDISALFSFAKAANLKVIYSLPLQNPSSCSTNLAGADATTASNIMSSTSQAPYLHSFAFGNEVDFHSYHTYNCGGKSQTVDPLISETQTGSTCSPGSAFSTY